MAATTLVDRALLRVSGGDARGFLQGLVTNDVALLGEARPLWAGLLSAQGKALFDFILWADGDDVLIDCEAEQADALARRLTLYRLRRPIEIARDEGLAVHWSPSSPLPARREGPGVGASPERAERMDIHPPPAQLAGPSDHAGGMVPRQLCIQGGEDPRLPALGCRWLAPPGDPALGWHEHRLRLGVAEGAAELGDILWLECNAIELNGVSFSKGCYVGQENTARMNWRNKVNRRLVVVPAEEAGPRTRIHYPELGLAVDHRRVDDLGDAIVPDWLSVALNN